jgi:hypothetical protein
LTSLCVEICEGGEILANDVSEGGWREGEREPLGREMDSAAHNDGGLDERGFGAPTLPSTALRG